jgi:hypothetical protein
MLATETQTQSDAHDENAVNRSPRPEEDAHTVRRPTFRVPPWKLRSRPVKGTAMQRVNEYRFYLLGQKLKALKDLNTGTSLRAIWWDLDAARDALLALLNDPLPLRVCRRAAQELVDTINGIVPQGSALLDKLSSLGGATLADNYFFISAALEGLEPVLSAECEAMDTYVVSKKGIYATSELIEGADQALSADIRALLSAQALRDLIEAGRCLAFDLDTACGFHLIRATESVIHAYYVAVTGQTPKRKDRNWGAYVRNLNAHKRMNPDSKVEPKLVALIDQIREHHRNVLMHPEETLTAEEALVLTGVCQSAITAFARGIKTISGKP